MTNKECETCVPTKKKVNQQKHPKECKVSWSKAEKCMIESKSTDWRYCKDVIYEYRQCILNNK